MKGITLIEVVMTIFVTSLISGFIIILISSYNSISNKNSAYSDYLTEKTKVVATINLASTLYNTNHAKKLEILNDSWKIYLDGDLSLEYRENSLFDHCNKNEVCLTSIRKLKIEETPGFLKLIIETDKFSDVVYVGW